VDRQHGYPFDGAYLAADCFDIVADDSDNAGGIDKGGLRLVQVD